MITPTFPCLSFSVERSGVVGVAECLLDWGEFFEGRFTGDLGEGDFSDKRFLGEGDFSDGRFLLGLIGEGCLKGDNIGWYTGEPGDPSLVAVLDRWR